MRMMTRRWGGTLVPVTMDMFHQCVKLSDDGVERHRKLCVRRTIDRLRVADDNEVDKESMKLLTLFDIILIVSALMTIALMLGVIMLRCWKGHSRLACLTKPLMFNSVMLSVVLIVFSLLIHTSPSCATLAVVNWFCCWWMLLSGIGSQPTEDDEDDDEDEEQIPPV